MAASSPHPTDRVKVCLSCKRRGTRQFHWIENMGDRTRGRGWWLCDARLSCLRRSVRG